MPTPINISASRGAAILGLSSWKTPVQSWLEIMESREPGFCERQGYKLPEFKYSPAMRWGHAFESAIIELAEKKQNSKISSREEFFKDDKEYITCHVDGIYKAEILSEKNHTYDFPLHEGKTTSFFYFHDNFGEPGTDKVPVEYQIQCQHQMICACAEKVILSVLVFPRRVEEWEEMGWAVMEEYVGLWSLKKKLENSEQFGISSYSISFWANALNQMGYFHQYEITAHPELQQKMIKVYTEFWNENILAGKEPAPQSYDDIKCLVTEPVGTIIANEEIERFIAEYKDIGKEISTSGPLAKKREQLKVMILDYMRHAGFTIDDESKDKWILRGQDGKRLVSYGKDKNGYFIFR